MHTPAFYEIRVQGHISDSWSSWFEGLTLRHEESGETVLSGTLVDEAALHGVLAKIRDLGLPLIEMKRRKQTMKKVLVLGGTGLLGGPVARCLQADGLAVRLLARDPEKARATFGDLFEVVAGDVTDQDSLEEGLAGCEGVHISVGGPVDRLSAENVASLAPGLGVKRITYISGATAAEENRWFPMTAQKLEAEKALCECGVPYTVFCPTWPMEQLPCLARGGQPLLIGDRPTLYHWFAADDLGRMVSMAYQLEEAANKRFFVHGPEAMTMQEALERYCRAFHPEVESVSVMPVDAARAVARSTGNQMLGFFAELMAYFDQAGEMGDPAEANEMLGAPATTLDAWIGGCLVERRLAEQRKGIAG
jgi:uncharacterized protein YbjT (DUF2867 family)